LAQPKQPPPFPPENPVQTPRPQGANRGLLVGIIIGILFVVLLASGIIAAIAIPNLLSAIQRSKQKRTMANIRTIATACEAYAVDHSMYPDATSIKELRPMLVPSYLKTLPEKDGWDRIYAYQSWKKDESQKGPTSYMIVSFGKDGVVDSEHYFKGVITTSFNNDIVYSDGIFWQYPEHSQP
jgi:general secretion pathway protein G